LILQPSTRRCRRFWRWPRMGDARSNSRRKLDCGRQDTARRTWRCALA
jgi:hypothetical protein